MVLTGTAFQIVADEWDLNGGSKAVNKCRYDLNQGLKPKVSGSRQPKNRHDGSSRSVDAIAGNIGGLQSLR